MNGKIKMTEFLNRCDRRIRDLDMAVSQLNGECMDYVDTTSPLYKAIMREIDNEVD